MVEIEGDNPRAARIQILAEPLDRAAFTRCIAPLKDDGDARTAFLGPMLELDQFDLQLFDIFLVGLF